MTKPARFSAADVARAVKAVRKAGCVISGAKIEPDGSILVLTEVARPANDINPLERHLHG